MKKIFLILSVLGVFLMPQGAQGFENLFYMSNLREKEGIESLKKNADKIDILGPQFYAVTGALTLSGSVPAEIKKIAAENNIKIMPLVANEGFKQDIMHKLLISPLAQDKIIKGLVYLAKKNNYIGWQFDFENINYKDRDLYSAFVEKTAKAFKKDNLLLSIAAVARNTDYEDTDFYKNWSGAFDYERIAKAADFISIMTYDDPKSKGPVASVTFVNQSLAYLKDKIPPEKLSMGIPLYYWGWSVSPLKKVKYDGTYALMQVIKASYASISGFLDEAGVPWLAYFFNNKAYIIWHENAKSFEIKLGIARQNNLRGFSAWVLGIEDPAIWTLLEN